MLGIVGSRPLVLRVILLIPSLHLSVKLVVKVLLVLGIGVVHKVVELALVCVGSISDSTTDSSARRKR